MLGARIRDVYGRQNTLRNHLRDAGLVAKDPTRYFARRRITHELSRPPIEIPKSAGYAITTAAQIPGLSEIQDQLHKLADKKLAELDLPFIETGAKSGAVKPFYFNLIDRDDVVSAPQLLSFALSEPMLSIVANYCGVLPEISHIAIFYSGLRLNSDADRNAEKAMRGTQNLHWDNHDLYHVKFFNYLDAVGENDGPLTLLPADKSWWLRKKTGRRFGTWPVRDDAEFKRYFSEKDLVPIIGPAGTAAFVDTTNCLHFGSRTRGSGQRKTFVVHYTKFADYGIARSQKYQDLNVATSPECRAALNLNRYGQLAYRLIKAQQ